MNRKSVMFAVLLIISTGYCYSQRKSEMLLPREHLLMDFDWRFAFGHPFDTKKDFDNGSGYFSYLAKASYGDGAAAANFDDRSWRKVNVPHDWAVEQPFSRKGSTSHGFKAIGRNFPDASIGWYRKTFHIPATDKGRHISIAFDGVFRNSIVWVNGFSLGTEPSGYTGFEYNISEYLNYGGENVIAVRVDATMEEGWFYEGAGIYRHVWLNKTSPLHVATDGSFVRATVKNNTADVSAQVTLINESLKNKTVDIVQTIINEEGKSVANADSKQISFSSYQQKDISVSIPVSNPVLWSLETPYLYKLSTDIIGNGQIIDHYETTFGIRTISFDAAKGFFLNGKPVKIHGTNNHQDHAGVGAALPDALQEYRIKKLKEFGVNAYRCSHNPPTPELLEACDRLGMLVIDENRLMGVTSTHYEYLKRLMLRDRNHPSIISWSIGNEEWGIEGNELGASIASSMQAFAKSIDSTRFITAAVSGGWRKGISNVIDVMGYNYIGQINTDEHHAEFPNQPSWGTEEGSTRTTRGIYADDPARQYFSAYDQKPNPSFYSIEDGWKYYAARDYLAGMFIWTGFDYRGEPTPYGWPTITAYHGMMDLCGFPKDIVYYLKSWWTDQPTLHILPHWNLPDGGQAGRKGKEGQEIDVWVYSNCDEVELFLNQKSLGKKRMQKNGHLEWNVKYSAGTLSAIGYRNGKKLMTETVRTTDQPVSIQLNTQQSTVKADKEDLAVITVAVNDRNNLQVPTANDEIQFSVTGPGKIIGVGNGDPTSLEPDKYIETITTATITKLKEKAVPDLNSKNETAATVNDTDWKPAFTDDRTEKFGQSVKALVYRGTFSLPENYKEATIILYYKNIGKEQSVYINGKEIAANFKEGNKEGYRLNTAELHAGNNSISILATPLLKKFDWENVNQDPGIIQMVFPAAQWKRKLFSGLAQIIIQSTGEPGEIIVTGTANGLKQGEIKIQAVQADARPALKGN